MRASNRARLAFLALAVFVFAQQITSTLEAPTALMGRGQLDELSTADAASQRMLDWLRSQGAEVNIEIKTLPGIGRGVFASKLFQTGDVMACIPVELLWANHNLSRSQEETALELMNDLANTDSPWRPYFDAFPAPHEIRCSLSIPVSYFPVIQDASTEWGLRYERERIQQLWQEYKQAHPGARNQALSAANLTYAQSLLRTRVFNYPTASILIPIVDMANHDNGCSHTHMYESCDPNEGLKQWQSKDYPDLANSAGSGGGSARSGQCMVWRAAQPVKQGQEVCNNYGAGLQDRILLHYGFLQSGEATEMLSYMDRHTQERALWNVPFQGNRTSTWAEIDRLAALLETLQSGEEAASKVQPDEQADQGGVYLAMLKEWRRQRIRAVHTELRRLYYEVSKQTAEFERWMSGTVEKGVDAVGLVKSKACAGSISRSGAAETAETSPGVLQKVLRAMNPWYAEL